MEGAAGEVRGGGGELEAGWDGGGGAVLTRRFLEPRPMVVAAVGWPPRAQGHLAELTAGEPNENLTHTCIISHCFQRFSKSGFSPCPESPETTPPNICSYTLRGPPLGLAEDGAEAFGRRARKLTGLHTLQSEGFARLKVPVLT